MEKYFGITSKFHMILWSVSFNAYELTAVGCLMSLFVTLVIRFSALSATRNAFQRGSCQYSSTSDVFITLLW